MQEADVQFFNNEDCILNKHKNRNSYLIDHLFKDNVQFFFRDNYVVK